MMHFFMPTKQYQLVHADYNCLIHMIDKQSHGSECAILEITTREFIGTSACN